MVNSLAKCLYCFAHVPHLATSMTTRLSHKISEILRTYTTQMIYLKQSLNKTHLLMQPSLRKEIRSVTVCQEMAGSKAVFNHLDVVVQQLVEQKTLKRKKLMLSEVKSKNLLKYRRSQKTMKTLAFRKRKLPQKSFIISIRIWEQLKTI